MTDLLLLPATELALAPGIRLGDLEGVLPSTLWRRLLRAQIAQPTSWDPANHVWTPSPPLPGSITTAMLAAHAVTQGHYVQGVTSNPSTTSAPLVNCPDMSIAFTAPVVEDLLCFLIIYASASAAGLNTGVAVSLDGVQQGGTLVTSVAVGAAFPNLTTFLYTGISAAAHTLTGQWSITGGTLTGVGTSRFLTCLELRA